MPELIQCPSCDRKLRVPDNLIGKKVKCPSCTKIFVAAAAEEDLPTAPLLEEEEPPKAVRRKPPPLPPPEDEGIEEHPSRPRKRPAPPPEDEDDEDDEEEVRPRRRRPQAEDDDEDEDEEERPRRKVGGKADWGRVRTGVTLVLVSILIMIGTVIIGMIAGFFIGAGAGAALASRPPGAKGPPVAPVVVAGTGFMMLAVFSFVMGLASQIAALVGYIFCMAAPQKYNARTLAMTTVGLAGGSLAFALIAGILSFTGGATGNPGVGLAAGGAAGILGLIGNVLNAAKYFTFLFFLMAVARNLRAYSLEKSAKNLAILSGVAMVGAVVWFVLTIVLVGAAIAAAPQAGVGALGASAIAMLACSCGMIVVGLAVFVWYIVVLVQARGVLGDYLARR